MSGGVITRSGQAYQLRLLLNSPDPLVLRLYQNDREPSAADTVAGYDEVVDRGYRGRTLSGSQWKTRESGGLEYPEQVYTFEAHQDVYGYYITLERSGELVAAERFDGAPYRVTPKDQIRIIPGIA